MSAQSSTLEQRLQRLLSYCALDANNVKLLRECVEVQYQLGNFDAARIQIHAALEQFPDDDLLQFQLATVEMASNHPELTCELLHALLARGIDNGNVRYNLAYALGLLGKGEEGLATLATQWDAVCREVPGTPLLKGKLQHHQGDVEGAIVTLRNYVEATPADAEGYGYLALLLTDKGDYHAAAEYAQYALGRNAEQFEALLAQGMVALSRGNAARAKTYFEKTTPRREEGGRSWLGLGLSEMATGNLAAGERALIKAVEYMPRHLGSWNTLAWAQISQGKIAEAEASLLQALEIDRNFSETHGSLAIVQMLRGDLDAARVSAKRAERLNPSSFAAAFANSFLIAQDGNQLEAQRMLQDIMQRPLDRSGKTLIDALKALRTDGITTVLH